MSFGNDVSNQFQYVTGGPDPYRRNGAPAKDGSGASYYNPTGYSYDRNAFTSARAAQLGQAAQGLGQVSQAGPAGVGSPSASQGYGYQASLLQQLQRQAMGQGPSLAAQQLQQATDQNIRQQLAMQSGRNNPLGAYTAAQAGSQMGQQAAGQAAQARLQEQLQAQGLLGQVAGQMRGQDFDYANANAQLQAQLGMFNAGQANGQLGADVNARNQFALQQGQFGQQANMLNAQQLAMYQQLMGGNDMWRQDMLNGQQNDQNAYLRQQQMADEAFRRQILMSLLGGGINAGSQIAGAAAMSDERQKKDIRPGGEEVRGLLRQLRAHSYEYKDPTLPGAAPGRHVSVMAQELERHPLGRTMVREEPHGKVVDYGRGLGTMLAAIADMNARVDSLEAGKGKR